VTDNLNRMNGPEDDVFTTAVKEAASTAFFGTQADRLSPISAHISFFGFQQRLKR